jgi:hypothetical protein
MNYAATSKTREITIPSLPARADPAGPSRGGSVVMPIPSVDFMAASAGGPHPGRYSAPEEFTFDMSPTKQIVNAAVEARLRISSPDLATVDGG